MKTILTKFVPCTNTRPARIQAFDGDTRLTFPYHFDDDRDPHRAAALSFARRLGWKGTLAQGGTKNGAAFVFVVPGETFEI